ncbi:exonuclease SbcCD subunit D C-terminal domain-containing protein, partial [Kosakonia cowanii]
LADMPRKIQQVTEDLPVEVLLLRRSRELRNRLMAGELRETLSELKVEEVFDRRLAQEELDEMQSARLHTLFSETRQALDEENNA